MPQRELKLLHDIILIKAEAAELMASGLYAPAQVQARNIDDPGELYGILRCGTVIAAGPGRRSKKTGARLPMKVKVGDRVLFTAWHGQLRQDQGALPAWADDERFMHESEIFAVVDDSPRPVS